MTSYGTAPPAPAKGSIGLALTAGLGAAVAGAFGWGLIAYVSRQQFSLVAVAVGLAVGYAVARFRAGDLIAAAASAVLAVIGCALGTFLALVFALAGAGVSMGSIVGHLDLIASAYPHALGGAAIAFWAVAAVVGFRIPLGPPRRRAAQPPAGQGAPEQPRPASPAAQPWFGTPASGTPASGTPASGTPASGTPAAGPAPGSG